MDDLATELRTILQHDHLIMCLGNRIRGDDTVGIYIGEKLISDVIIAENSPVNFLGIIVKRNPHTLLIIDAIETDLDPGTIILSDERLVMNTHSLTTHYQELSDILLFLHKSGINPQICILGVQIKTIELMDPMSSDVIHSADKIISIINSIKKII